MQAPAPALGISIWFICTDRAVPKEAPPVISDDEDESCFPESDDVIQMEDEITFHPNIVTPVTLPNAAERCSFFCHAFLTITERRNADSLLKVTHYLLQHLLLIWHALISLDDLLSITTKAQAIWRGRSQRKLFAHRGTWIFTDLHLIFLQWSWWMREII